MQSKVTVKFAAATLSIVMVVFSVGMPFVHATNLEVPQLNVPELGGVPELNTPEINTPELETPELEVPELETPELEVPELETPELEVPELEVPELDIPELEVPELDIPELDIPDLDIPDVEIPEVNTHFCRINATASVVTTGSSVTVKWETSGYNNITINGELVSGAYGEKTFTNITENTLFKLIAKDGNNTCTATVYVSCIPPTSDLACTLEASKLLINPGESVELSWTTDGANNVSIDRGIGAVTNPNGVMTVSPNETTTYTLMATDGHDEVRCPVTIKVKEVEEKECKLVIEKTADKAVAKPGDTITYTLAIENVGTKDCTGGGVQVVDELSSRLTYIDATYTSNLSGGYGSQPVHKNGVVRFNGHTLTPGEKGSMVIFAKVKEAEQCGDFEIKNKAQTTARELNYFKTWVYSNEVVTHIDNDCEVPNPMCESFSVTPNSFSNGVGGDVTLTWETSNTDSVTIDNGIGAVAEDGSVNTSVTATTLFTLTATGNGKEVSCPAKVTVEQEAPAPTCDSFTVTPNSFSNGGGEVVLTWTTSNTDSVTIDNGIGAVAENGSTNATVTNTTTFTLTATGNGKEVSCPAKVTVETETPAPTCDSFTATPNNFTNGTGGNVTLTWTTSNTDSVLIDNGVGSVAEDGTTDVSVSTDTTFILTAVGNGTSVQCPVVVTVDEPQTTNLSCDTFTASPTEVLRGGETYLAWETTDAVKVSINNGVGDVSVDGNKAVEVADDTLFTLTAEDQFGNTRQCDVNVTTRSGGGGGGGSSSPRCDLDISDRKVKAGERVTLTWDNTRTNEMVIEDNRGNVIVDTEEDDDIDEDEGSITVRPTRDTEYSMTVSRGSRDRVCRVQVEVEDDVTVIESRTQTPQVAGIALTQVPYTGFEAGPFLTFLFYTLLAIWAAFIAYLLVVRERTVMGVSLSSVPVAEPTIDTWETMVDEMHEAAHGRDETEEVAYISPAAGAPANLPTGEAPVFGYEALNDVVSPMTDEVLDPMTELENAAHAEQTLLSSDAIHYFMEQHTDATDRIAALHATIADAKAKFPTEGGWLVLNLDRVHELTRAGDAAPSVAPVDFIPETRVGVSSLAEAIATGNVVAAYDMIGHRPMFALADAAADLDAVYRMRKGMEATASELLEQQTRSLTDVQIEAMIKALTGALDGAYENEEAAVKMAIMKAIKATA